MIELLATGLLLGLTHAMPPGPITVEVLRRGAAEGVLPALKVDAGSVVADAVFFTLVAVGLMQVIDTHGGKLLVWALGCLLLLALGIRDLYKAFLDRSRPSSELSGKTAGYGSLSPFLTGFVICITSPFAVIWWTGVFAGSTALFNPGYGTMFPVFVGIALAVLAWYGIIGISGTVGGRFLPGKVLDMLSILCAAMMLIFAAVLFYHGYMTLF